MCRDLENRIGGSVDDPRAGALLLVGKVVDDRRSAGHAVGEDRPTRGFGKSRNHIDWKAVWVSGKRFGQMKASDLPMPRRRIFPRRPREHGAPRADGIRFRFDTRNRCDVAQSETRHVGEPEPADRAGNVADRIAATIAVRRTIGRFTASYPIEHEDQRSPVAVEGSHQEVVRGAGL